MGDAQRRPSYGSPVASSSIPGSVTADECLNVQSLGATPAEVGAAVDAALTVFKTAAGGTICIPPLRADGYWTWKHNVLQNMGTNAAPAHVDLQGNGAAIRLDLDVKADHMYLVQGMGSGQVEVRELVFTSVNPGDDCATVLCLLSGPIDTIVSHCSFWGIQTSTAQQGIIRMGGRNTDIKNCGFHGCAALGAHSGAIAMFMDTQRVDSCFFERQGTFRNVAYTKNGGRASILIRAQAAQNDPNLPPGPAGANVPIGYSGITRTYFEDESITEGQIKCDPIDEPGLDHVEEVGCVHILPLAPAAALMTVTGAVVGTPGFGLGTKALTSQDCAFFGGASAAPRLADLQQLDLFTLIRPSLYGADPPMVTKVHDLVKEMHIENWLFDRPALDTFDNLPTGKVFYVKSGVQTEFPANVGTPFAWWTSDAGITLNAGGVAQWQSQNGASDATKTVVQANAALQPIWTRRDPAFNNQPSLSFFAATGQFLSSAAFGAALAPGLTWYIVAQSNNTGANKCFFDGNTVGARNQFDSTNVEVGQYYAGGAGIVGVASLLNPFVACITEPAAGGSSLYVNNSQVADVGPGAAGNQGIAGISIGVAFDGVSEPLDGKICEIICFAAVHTAAERARVFAYLAQKYGIAAS